MGIQARTLAGSADKALATTHPSSGALIFNCVQRRFAQSWANRLKVV